MNYSSTKLYKRVFFLLTLAFACVQLSACGQRGPLTMPEDKTVSESTAPVSN